MRNLGLSALAAVALLLPACSSSSGTATPGGIGNAMFILTCSVGCPSGQGGLEVHCTGLTIAPNQAFVVTFSQHVDPGSVSAETFSIIDTDNGSTPLGTRLVDPVDPRRVVFRPAITFDSQGNPSFGFGSNRTYQITIKGTTQDPIGPYIRSTAGKPNSSRMSCQLHIGSNPVDYVPGPPSSAVFVTVSDAPIPNDTPADGADHVALNSTIRIQFDDIMNPVTLANPITHQATFTTVKVDIDGDLNTLGDQVTLAGNYVVAMDLVNLRTLMTFTSSSGLPSSGNLNPLPRQVVVTMSSSIQDLAGNGLANPGSIHFIPDAVTLPPVTLPDDNGENFNDTVFDQADLSSGAWGSGRLNRGFGGGSGRLGALTVRQGGPVDLSTDSQVFPLDPITYPSAIAVRDLLDNSIPGVDYTPGNPSTWPNITVTNGIFEFSSLRIEAFGTLRFHGNNSARVLVRGPVTIQGNGTLDVKGGSAVPQASDVASGGNGGVGGPNGGSGGTGADRFDNSAFPSLQACGAISNPGADTNGGPGGGVGQIAGLGAAPGGAMYPNSNLPNSSTAPPSVNGGLCWTVDFVHFDPFYTGCQCLQFGAPGGGATYGDGTAVVGGPGVSQTPMPTNETGGTNIPANTGPGAGIPIEPPDPQSGHVVRKLDADLGYLRGGSAGGGGGMSLFGTETSGIDSPCGGQPIPATTGYQDNSAAGGGGGGGAVQLVSGSGLLIDGVIDARGGNGAGADTSASGIRRRQAAPGGGGAGGAVRLQAPQIEFAPVAGRINITGGAGGITDTDHRTTFTLNATGGAGSSGLVRIEDLTGTLSRITEAPSILPFDPTDLHPTSGQPESQNFLSVGAWAFPRKRPESFTGSTSCWLQPASTFFLLQFNDDDLSNPDPELRYGWNMDVVWNDNDGTGEHDIAYRGPDLEGDQGPFSSGDFETFLGNTLNHGLPAGQGSYFCIRFQGAKSTASIVTHPCSVALTGSTPDILPGSLTPWVRHPKDLNSFSPRPDMVRFCVVFDNALVLPGQPGAFIKGVTNIRIHAQPD